MRELKRAKGLEAGKSLKNHKHRGILRQIRMYIDRNRIGELLVTNGVISPFQLRKILRLQKTTNQPLGQVLLKNNIVSKGQLAQLLFRQAVLRVLAGIFFAMAAFSQLSDKKAKAENIRDVPALMQITPAAGFPSYTPLAKYPGLFGSNEKESRNLDAFTKWTGMFERFEAELQTTQNSRLMRDWQKAMRGFETLPLYDMAERVNALVNQKPYILDQNNWGKSDYWATPIEFLRNGGDCEDFAIMKYTALRSLGVPEHRLRLAIVHDNEKNIPHAVLVVYTDNQVVILDNQIKTVVNAARENRYRPIFSINRTAWWLHTSPDATMVASVQ